MTCSNLSHFCLFTYTDVKRFLLSEEMNIMQNDEMFERTVKPVLDVNENHNQRNGHF